MNNGNSSSGSNHNNNNGSATAPSSLSSICDFLGGSDKKEKVEKQTPPSAATVQGTKGSANVKKASDEVKPIQAKMGTGALEEVYRPSKAKKSVHGEDMKENKPISTNPGASEDFPSLGGPTRGKLGANFVKAEDKLFKPKAVPSQWSQDKEIKTNETSLGSKAVPSQWSQ